MLEIKGKVIGFDSWTGGVQHFSRLVPALKEKGLELQLVHIGSWGNEPDCPYESIMNDMVVRDIAYYGSDSFEKILDIEKPVAVILTSTNTFAHRAFIRYCEQRSIPTLNLYHGLVDVTGSEGTAYAASKPALIRFVISKIGKLLRHTFPCYIKALLKTNANKNDWIRFLSDIYHLAVGKNYFKGAADDAKTTKCAVYIPADIKHAMQFYGFMEQDVFVVGNSDLLHFPLDDEMLAGWQSPEEREKFIMYIETGFSSVGLFYNDEEDFSNHIIKTSHALAAQGYNMCLKLKPNSLNVNLLDEYIKPSGVELISNENFLKRLINCSACIAETTSLAIVPALVGMPLFMANYGRLKTLEFGSILTSYPRGYLLKDLSDISDIMKKDAQTGDRGKLVQWINFNAGPLPSEKMPYRVVAIVEEMIANANRSI